MFTPKFWYMYWLRAYYMLTLVPCKVDISRSCCQYHCELVSLSCTNIFQCLKESWIVPVIRW